MYYKYILGTSSKSCCLRRMIWKCLLLYWKEKLLLILIKNIIGEDKLKKVIYNSIISRIHAANEI